MKELQALSVIAAWLSLTALVGIYTSWRYRRAGSESWFVAGRKLGTLILWLSLGANIYSAYTFLGLPGYTVVNGAKVLAILLYGQLSYILAFLITPKLWTAARENKYITISDYFEFRYQSKALGLITAVAGGLFSIPYIQLQIQGVGYIIDEAGYGLIDPLLAKLIAFALIALFTIIGGMMSVALINALQGAMMLVAIWGISFLVPLIHFGSWSNMFSQVEAVKPELLTLSPDAVVWAVTTMVGASLGFWMWPNRLQGIFTAKSADVVKKNSAALSFFQLSQIPIILAGLATAALFYSGKLSLPLGPGGKPIADYALIRVINFTFPPWVVGLVGAGAIAAAISTAAALLHTSGALFSRNAYQRVIMPTATDRQLVLVARAFTATIALIALALAIYSPRLIVYLLLTAYAGVTQFFPGVVLGLWWKKVKREGVLAGLLAGIVVAILTRAVWKDPLGIYGGLWGLAVNLPLTVGISLLKSKET